MKICIIGAGSSYTPELIEGLINRREELPIKEIWLVDIEDGREKLDIIFNLTNRMLKKYGLKWKIFKTLNRIDGIKNADFIMTQIRVGLLAARIIDERVPLSNGMLGQETNGMGGLFKLVRTLPVMLEINADIHKHAPDAWMLNFSNPAGMVTEGLIKYGKHKKLIGLCNVPITMRKGIANQFGVDIDDVFIKFAGMNHFVWGLEATINGVDKKDEILKNMSNIGEAKGKKGVTMQNIVGEHYEYSELKKLKAVPCSYHRYYLLEEKMLKHAFEDFSKGETRAEVVLKLEKSLFKKYQNLDLDTKPEELSKRGGAMYSEIACELVSQIYNDKNTFQVVNIQNKGTITNLPYDSAIEVISKIGKDGPKPLEIGDLPKEVFKLTNEMKIFEIKAVDAIINKDKKAIFEASLLNPLTHDEKIAKKVFDELWVKHKKYINFD